MFFSAQEHKLQGLGIEKYRKNEGMGLPMPILKTTYICSKMDPYMSVHLYCLRYVTPVVGHQ